jgi:hypothetical protein
LEIGSLFGDRITQDMEAEPLKVRKATLARTLKKAKPGLQFSEHITVPGQLRRPAVLKGRREFFDAPAKLEGRSVKPAIMAFVHAFISYRAKAGHRQFESVRRVNDVVELELQIGRDGWGIHSGVWKSRRVAQTARRGAH